ncbi:MAG: hypothetical protein ACHQ52_14110 [Candidatus Eisenbacteria bacterium]
MVVLLTPSVAGAIAAAAAVAGGAPLFSEGLRALRIARLAVGLAERPLAEKPHGFTGSSGQVTLDGPLFSPITHQPCAGFRLSVASAERGQVASIEERRPFRIVSGGVSARIAGPIAHWRLAAGARREVKANEPLSEHLASLVERSAEASWLRRTGATLVLTEHLLAAGATCHVVGHVRAARHAELIEHEWARTGTDDHADVVSVATRGDEPDLWIDEGGSLECLIVSDQPVREVRLRHTRVRMLGLVVGPLISLGGLLALARIAESWMPAGRP